MNEVEAKILDIDKTHVIAQLESFGAKKIFDGTLINHIYKKEGFKGLYRIRESIQKDGVKHPIIVALKIKSDENTDNVKVMDEREHVCESVDVAKTDAKTLGFEFEKTLEKTRIEYALAEAHFALDTYPNIPTFLEIEAPNEMQVLAWAQKLGFKEEQLKPWGYTKLLKHYTNK